MKKYTGLLFVLLTASLGYAASSPLQAPDRTKPLTAAQQEQATYVLNEFTDIISAVRSVYFKAAVGANTPNEQKLVAELKTRCQALDDSPFGGVGGPKCPVQMRFGLNGHPGDLFLEYKAVDAGFQTFSDITSAQLVNWLDTVDEDGIAIEANVVSAKYGKVDIAYDSLLISAFPTPNDYTRSWIDESITNISFADFSAEGVSTRTVKTIEGMGTKFYSTSQACSINYREVGCSLLAASFPAAPRCFDGRYLFGGAGCEYSVYGVDDSVQSYTQLTPAQKGQTAFFSGEFLTMFAACENFFALGMKLNEAQLQLYKEFKAKCEIDPGAKTIAGANCPIRFKLNPAQSPNVGEQLFDYQVVDKEFLKQNDIVSAQEINVGDRYAYGGGVLINAQSSRFGAVKFFASSYEYTVLPTPRQYIISWVEQNFSSIQFADFTADGESFFTGMKPNGSVISRTPLGCSINGVAATCAEVGHVFSMRTCTDPFMCGKRDAAPTLQTRH